MKKKEKEFFVSFWFFKNWTLENVHLSSKFFLSWNPSSTRNIPNIQAELGEFFMEFTEAWSIFAISRMAVSVEMLLEASEQPKTEFSIWKGVKLFTGWGIKFSKWSFQKY